MYEEYSKPSKGLDRQSETDVERTGDDEREKLEITMIRVSVLVLLSLVFLKFLPSQSLTS